jgi:hypothetical protein
MTTLGINIDPGPQTTAGPGSFATERNEHEVRCAMCARSVYVDEATFRFANEAITSGLDNPYRCEICAEEYDDLAQEG